MELMETIWQNNPPSKEKAKELLSLSLEDKLVYTCANISGWDMFTNGNWYISFSGGKDSTVLLYIAAAMMNQMTVQPHPLRVLFCDTGLEFPEIRKFVPWYINWLSEKFPRITIDYTRKRPEKRFDCVIKEYGYPVISKEVSQKIKEARNGSKSAILRLNGDRKDKDGDKNRFNIEAYKFLLDSPFLISHQCCNKSKKEPAHHYERKSKLFPMVATMAVEGKLRFQKWLQSGCNAYEGKRPTSKPMSFWTEQDVLNYILQENIPICSVYGDILPFDGENYCESSLIDVPLKCAGRQRTGCIFCAFGAHLEKGDDQRFVRLKQTHPKHWNYAINGGEWDPLDGMWKPSRTPGHIGLGMGRVLDFIGVPYE